MQIRNKILALLAASFGFLKSPVIADTSIPLIINNFGFPGTLEMPNARSLPDGELVITQQLHRSLSRTGASFQFLPNIGFAFRYSGHGRNGHEAYGRINHDRSFDTHITLLKESKYQPALSIGMRDFIGTGWYSSEYIVGTKSIGNLEISAGLGFGRLAGAYAFENPFAKIFPELEKRGSISVGRGGTLGNINWFQGNTSAFYSATYKFGKKISLSAEYSPDLMQLEASYLPLASNWNFGAAYQLNNYVSISGQYLYGNTYSLTANISANPSRPPFNAGMELAPVPMRMRSKNFAKISKTDIVTIRKVLEYDKFKILNFTEKRDQIRIDLLNRKFRSTAQAVGRVTSTLQRFTSDEIKNALIIFYKNDVEVASYSIDLEKATFEQFSKNQFNESDPAIKPIDLKASSKIVPNKEKKFLWSVGPYITHRLFNPDLPLSLETGLEVASEIQIVPGLILSGSVRKSVLTNLTDNKRLNSGSPLPRVHSNWPLYDIAGQDGHINNLTLSYIGKLGPGFFGRTHAGLLEAFFAGAGAEILFKPASSSFALGFDIHRVRQREFDMKFDLQDYMTTSGHLTLYYDAGGMFNIELSTGRYLAGDWGGTAKISRVFRSGWEVGAYATLTDVPFAVFGEGSFDKAIYASIPIDWLLGTPTQSKRKLELRPITRDGGAQLASARKLYKLVSGYQGPQFYRERGRLWK